MRSPRRTPALSAGLPGSTNDTSAPAPAGRSTPRARVAATSWTPIPTQISRTRPYWMSSLMISRATLTGMAKPMPSDPPLAEKMNELMPMTSPRPFTSGPPEFPGLMAASVWIMSLYTAPVSGSASTSRWSALTTPAVTVGCRSFSRYPNGFPIAMAHSPIITSSESPNFATGSLSPSILTTATS